MMFEVRCQDKNTGFLAPGTRHGFENYQDKDISAYLSAICASAVKKKENNRKVAKDAEGFRKVFRSSSYRVQHLQVYH